MPNEMGKSEKSENQLADYYANLTEKSYYESSYVSQTLLRPYNPDDLFQKYNDYSIYEDMLKDDQVNACMQLKLDLVCGSGWDIISTGETNEDIATETHKIIEENGDVSLDEYLEDFAKTAYAHGFSIAEKIFELTPSQMLTLKSLKTRHPGSWLIDTDEHGNLVKYVQHGPKGDVEINPKTIIHYVNNREQQNPYGVSDLRKCYQAWFTKTHITRYYSIFLEKAAGPIPVGRYPASLPQERVNELFNIIKGFQAKTSVVIPKEVEMEFLQANGNGEAYVKGINLFNMFIGRSLFVPDLVGFQGSETGGGSFTLGKNQMDLFFKHISKRRRHLERLVNKHIIQPICNWNYGITEDFPKFQFKPISDENALDYARIFLEAVKGKVYKPTPEEINHLRSLIKFPESDEVEFYEEQDPSVQGQGFGDPNKEAMETEEKEEKQPEEKPKEKEVEKKDFRLKTVQEKRVDFALIKGQLETGYKEVVAESKPIVNKIVKDYIRQIEQKGVLNNVEKLDSLKVKYLNELNRMLKDNFTDHYKKMRKTARHEVLEFEKKDFAADRPLDIEGFLKTLDEETYQYIGDWEYGFSKDIRTEIIKAVKDGRPLSDIEGIIIDKTVKNREASLERYARTKYTELMNRARIEEFESTGIVEAYQYSAIMDERTSDICAELDGKIFESDETPIPPLHFNCRSLLVPITKFEEYSTDTKTSDGKNLDKFIEGELEDTGFSRFTKQEKPKITDVGVDFKMVSTGNMDTTTYSLNGKPFEQIIITYADQERKNIVSKEHKRLDDGEKV